MKNLPNNIMKFSLTRTSFLYNSYECFISSFFSFALHFYKYHLNDVQSSIFNSDIISIIGAIMHARITQFIARKETVSQMKSKTKGFPFPCDVLVHVYCLSVFVIELIIDFRNIAMI